MVGIVGYANDSEGLQSVFDDMVKSLVFTDKEQIDKTCDEYMAIARVSHGRINPETQPIFNEDKSLCVVMEGELFDYESSRLELIKRGYTFKYEKNDAEYCLHLYEDMGVKAFEKLNGSFCIVIYHTVTNELLLINDRFSSYELFYYLTKENTLLFSSQLSSILQSPKVQKQLDIGAVFEFFTFHRVLGTKTYYKDIMAMPPATVLRFRDGVITLSPYWEMKYHEESHSRKYYVDKFAHAIKTSTERRTKGNDRLGILLSSGFDSRMVFSASNKKMVAFTFDDFESEEIKTVRRITKIKDCKHILLRRDQELYQRIVSCIDKEVDIGNGMFSLEHFHAIPFMDSISKECDVLFQANKFGVFYRGSNYPRRSLKVLGKQFRIPFIERLTDERLSDVVLDKYRYSLYSEHPEQLFMDSYSSILKKTLKDSIEDNLEEANGRTENIYDKYIWLDAHYISRFPSVIFEHSIRHYMDSRDVFYDNDLFDLYLKMPFKLRTIGTSRKLFLLAMRKVNPEIASIPRSEEMWPPIASPFLYRISKLVQVMLVKVFGIQNNKGVGWISPSKLIRNNGKLKERIWDIINDKEALDPSIFDIERIKEFFNEHLEGKHNNYFFIYSLVVFGIWHKKYGGCN